MDGLSLNASNASSKKAFRMCKLSNVVAKFSHASWSKERCRCWQRSLQCLTGWMCVDSYESELDVLVGTADSLDATVSQMLEKQCCASCTYPTRLAVMPSNRFLIIIII